VIAYELGYRIRPLDQLSLSFATFYNSNTINSEASIQRHSPRLESQWPIRSVLNPGDLNFLANFQATSGGVCGVAIPILERISGPPGPGLHP